MKSKAIYAALLATGAAASALGSPFTAGDVVVYRVGTGTGTLANTGNSVFLDEYTTGGTLVQSISTGLLASGTATSEGLITLNGSTLAIAGYKQLPAAGGSIVSSTSTDVNRSVQLYGLGGTQTAAQTNLSDWVSGNNPRSVVSDGTNLWLGSPGATGGVNYNTVGASTGTLQIATPTPNVRQLNIFGGQLYYTTAGGLFALGTGTPTTSTATSTALVTATSSYGFYFTKLNGASAGMDTLYVADDSGTGTISQFSLVSGVWTGNGSVTAAGVRGLAGTTTANGVQLVASTGGSTSTGGGTLYSLTDSSGFNTALSAPVGSFATAGANTSFRGVVLITPEPASMAVLGIGLLAVIRRRRSSK
jgi:hypothetical protein